MSAEFNYTCKSCKGKYSFEMSDSELDSGSEFIAKFTEMILCPDCTKDRHSRTNPESELYEVCKLLKSQGFPATGKQLESLKCHLHIVQVNILGEQSKAIESGLEFVFARNPHLFRQLLEGLKERLNRI